MRYLGEGEGICQRLSAEGANYWRGAIQREKPEKRKARHSRARILCNKCPLLEACEEYLVACEKRKEHIDGVVAGRFSIVRPNFESTTLRECMGCGHALKSPNGYYPPGARQHAGEGLCAKCYPVMRRRKNEKSRI